jgi:hypothetical protein
MGDLSALNQMRAPPSREHDLEVLAPTRAIMWRVLSTGLICVVLRTLESITAVDSLCG